MSDLAFLLDEHVPLWIRIELVRREPRVRVYCIGESPAPAKGTPDDDLLTWSAGMPMEFQD